MKYAAAPASWPLHVAILSEMLMMMTGICASARLFFSACRTSNRWLA